MFLTTAAIFAATFAIDVAPARIRLVADVAELRVLCRTDRTIRGCTEFLGETLTCDCRRSEGGWTITARVQLIPYMYLSNRHRYVIEHEQLHIDDLRRQISDYLDGVTRIRYPDRESCEAIARFESATFLLRMDLFRDLSNQRLH
jgi:hypothetical protein